MGMKNKIYKRISLLYELAQKKSKLSFSPLDYHQKSKYLYTGYGESVLKFCEICEMTFTTKDRSNQDLSPKLNFVYFPVFFLTLKDDLGFSFSESLLHWAPEIYIYELRRVPANI